MRTLRQRFIALGLIAGISACAHQTRETSVEQERELASPVMNNSPTAAKEGEAWVCSFNVQWVGFSNSRDDQALAQLMKDEDCEIVVVQEIIAPPEDAWVLRGADPDFIPEKRGRQLMYPTPDPKGRRNPLRGQSKTSAFFAAMEKAGYPNWVLSPGDTGPNNLHSNNSDTEWFAVFYRGQHVQYAPDLPKGYLDLPLAKHPVYDRVPFAFPFRAKGGFDFVLISVHLAADANQAARRQDEMNAIQKWIREQSRSHGERDFIVLGDFNIEDAKELSGILPDRQWESLNEACEATNTSPREGKPYDHVFLSRSATTIREVPSKLGNSAKANLLVVNLLEKMEKPWARANRGKPYPGGGPRGGKWEGYDHTVFRTSYSDHHPIKFKISKKAADDDQ